MGRSARVLKVLALLYRVESWRFVLESTTSGGSRTACSMPGLLTAQRRSFPRYHQQDLAVSARDPEANRGPENLATPKRSDCSIECPRWNRSQPRTRAPRARLRSSPEGSSKHSIRPAMWRPGHRDPQRWPGGPGSCSALASELGSRMARLHLAAALARSGFTRAKLIGEVGTGVLSVFCGEDQATKGARLILPRPSCCRYHIDQLRAAVPPRAGQTIYGWSSGAIEKRRETWKVISAQAGLPEAERKQLRPTCNVLWNRASKSGLGRWVLGHAARDINDAAYMRAEPELIAHADSLDVPACFHAAPRSQQLFLF